MLSQGLLGGLLCGAVIAGCGSPNLRDADGSSGVDGGAPPDGSVIADSAVAPPDAGMIEGDAAAPIDAGTGGMDAGSAAADAGVPRPDAGPTTEPIPDAFLASMTYVTANIGRDYAARSEMVAALDRVGDALDARSGPRFIGWQEIGEGDPCGASCEIDALRARFASAQGWDTRHPMGTRPTGGSERVKVPVTSKGANADVRVRAVFASPGWAGVSPTRFVTVVHYPSRNLSVINTHFIAGAWSCRSEVARRRDYWRQAWNVLRAEVATEHDRGRNVVITGDLNRPRAADSCNPAWDPTSVHAGARVIGGAGIDYIFAVPAAPYRFVLARRADGTVQEGSIALGIDSHRAHWVAGRFMPR